MKYFFFAILAVIVIAVVYCISTHNTLVELQNRISEAFSTMDVYLVKRSDLIPNLVATVKGYAKHETESLEKVVNARARALGASSNADKLAAENELTGAISRLFALAESYPDLKANTNFLSLQADLKEMEGDIASARRYYNGVVRKYNTMLQTIPSRFIASAMGLQREPMFEVADEKQRENVKVEF
ncbi:MAG: LemA family protein [Erysipelotrichaceae bacterium]|nr:LemA family protein [Erysipelotrichaceae bacterium]MBR5049075.1 LemA family protein [Erysipelotrichaceae bacterium]